MKSKVDLILQSFKELSKRKVKRYADVWSTKISELYLVRNHIDHNQVPFISKCFLTNNFLHDQTVQSILKCLLPQIVDKKGLSIEDYSITSYVYSCIDEDISSEVILSNNYSEELIRLSSDNDLLTFLKTISLLLSKQNFGKIYQDSKTVLNISNNLIDYLWNRINSINTKYLSETVEYLLFSELLLESIFISNLIGKLNKEFLNHELIDYGSIFSLIKISQFLSSEKKQQITNQIYLSDYNTILDTLRKTYYFRLVNFDFTQHLFNRLCNTTAKSKMCRSEAMSCFNYTVGLIESKLKAKEGDLDSLAKLARLQVHLKSIQNSHALENPHRSRIRWNYPCLIT